MVASKRPGVPQAPAVAFLSLEGGHLQSRQRRHHGIGWNLLHRLEEARRQSHPLCQQAEPTGNQAWRARSAHHIAFLRPTLRLKRRCRRPAQHRPGESSGQLQPAAENRGQRLHEAVQQAGRLVVRHRDRLPPRLPDGRARHRPSDRGVPAASRLDELLQRRVEALGRVGPGVGSATEVDVAPHTAVNDRVQAARVLRVFAWVNPLYLDTSVMVVSELA